MELDQRIDVPQSDLPYSDDEPKGLAKAGQHLVEQLLRLGIDGFGPFANAENSAREALRDRSPEHAVRVLIRNHCLVAGGQGFVTNLGGFITLPVALPANIGAAYLIQTHLAAAIASVHGHDLDGEEVRTAILLCLLGNAGAEVVKQLGIKVGVSYSAALLKRLPVAVIRAINRKVGFTLVAKYGSKRALLTLSKGFPIVGGGVGGTVDLIATRAVGRFADVFFRPSDSKS